MSHEIDKHDAVVLNKEQAWHGLGLVLPHAPTPLEALTHAPTLDFTVEGWPLVATNGEGKRLALDRHVANVRTDVDVVLGIVSPGYQVFQPREVAEFCAALAEQNDKVVCESVGSIRNGAKIWYLLQAESFCVRDADEVRPYVCVSNGYDGLTAFRCTYSFIRVVCKNTLSGVIPLDEHASRRKLYEAAYIVQHVGDLRSRVEEAKAALKLYGKTLDTQRELIDELAAKDVSREAVQAFWLESYTRDFGAIAVTPTTDKEKKARGNALDAVAAMSRRFDAERDLAGPTAWNALNAYSGWLQHERTRGPKGMNRSHSVLMGTDSRRTAAAFAKALAL